MVPSPQTTSRTSSNCKIIQIDPKAYKTPDTFAYDRDCLIEMSKAYNDAYPPAMSTTPLVSSD